MRRFSFIVKTAISISLLSYVIYLVDFPSVLSRYSEVVGFYLLVALVLLITQWLLSTLKWKVLLSADDIDVRYPILLKTYVISNFFSLFLPTSFGGDVYRVAALRSSGHELAKSTSSVLFDRLSGLFALVTISLVAYLSLEGVSHKVTIGVAYIGSMLLFLILLSDAVFKKISGRPHFRIVRAITALLNSFRKYIRIWHTLFLALTISFLFQLNTVLVNKLYTLALDIDVPITKLLVVVPLIYLTEALPISINGLGVRESAFLFFFVLIGERSEDALAVALMVVAIRYSLGLVGGSLLLIESLRSAKRPQAM